MSESQHGAYRLTLDDDSATLLDGAGQLVCEIETDRAGLAIVTIRGTRAQMTAAVGMLRKRLRRRIRRALDSATDAQTCQDECRQARVCDEVCAARGRAPWCGVGTPLVRLGDDRARALHPD